MRAAADRCLYDTANLSLLLAALPGDALARPCGTSGWTVGQTIAHLVGMVAADAEAIERFVAGETPPQPTETADASWSAEDLAAAIPRARNRMLAALERVKFAHAARLYGERKLADTVLAWGEHSMEHALDFTDAVPELCDDPMVLNWVLWQTPGAAPGLVERQARLYERVKDRLMMQTEEGSNRKRNLAKRLVKKR